MFIKFNYENTNISFDSPIEVISAYSPGDIMQKLKKVQDLVSSGYYAAGFISYEAGFALEDAFQIKKTADFPLLYMGIYKRAGNDHKTNKKSEYNGQLKIDAINIAQSDYFDNIQEIREYIAAGDVYQITYCIKTLLKYSGDKLSLYEELLRRQPVPYPAYIRTDKYDIASLSPELFFKKRGSRLTAKPMKGTWRRGKNLISDTINKYKLHFDEKNRAENVMIADLLRNDMGKIGCSIRAPKLFEVDGYTTLFQMTSTVTADVKKELPFYDVISALHPSGSVTGAPKIRAMQIIKEIEREERKIYTGAIGYITPENDYIFNVPIRTLLFDGQDGEAGIGGGIVWDSTPEGEWDECMLKATFLRDIAV